MAAKTPMKDSHGAGALQGLVISSELPSKQLQPQSMSLPVKAETPPSVAAAAIPRPPPQSSLSSDAESIYIPSYSRWFSWENVHGCEVRALPEFFDSRSPSKNPRVYMYFRNSIIKQYRDNHPRKITFTDVRRTLIGDVGSIRRVFDFLESWGLVNYSASALSKPLKWDEKDGGKGSGDTVSEHAVTAKETSKRTCSGCKSVCSIACFYCEKYDLTLCARCYVRGNYRVGVNSSEFKRIEISDESRTQWTEKETLQLLEAVMHYGDDWRKVAQHVGGRSEACVSHFIKLPFGEEFVSQSDSGESKEVSSQMTDDDSAGSIVRGGGTYPQKRARLTPLADSSNPIMAQAAFLSALAGIDAAEAAAQAAVTALSQVDDKTDSHGFGSVAVDKIHQDNDAAPPNGETPLNGLEMAYADAHFEIDKEEQELENTISDITVKMKDILEKIDRFEELDMQMEKERKLLEQMRSFLFVDRLNILFHRSRVRKIGGRVEESVRNVS